MADKEQQKERENLSTTESGQGTRNKKASEKSTCNKLVAKFKAPVESTSVLARRTANGPSFRRRLQNRSRKSNTEHHCELCGQPKRLLDAVHLWDYCRADRFNELYMRADESDNLPDSVHSTENGILLCPTCHKYFDHKDRILRIKPDGAIEVNARGGEGGEDEDIDKLHNTPVPWAERIGKAKYPSAALLQLVYDAQYRPGKSVRDDAFSMREELLEVVS